MGSGAEFKVSSLHILTLCRACHQRSSLPSPVRYLRRPDEMRRVLELLEWRGQSLPVLPRTGLWPRGTCVHVGGPGAWVQGGRYVQLVLTVAQLLRKLPAFCGTQRFITVFTRARHWSLFWAWCIQSTLFHLISLRPFWYYPSIYAHIFQVFLPFRFSPMRATWPAHLILMKLLIMMCSRHCFPLPQHPQ
jgi:hypothetical protein